MYLYRLVFLAKSNTVGYLLYLFIILITTMRINLYTYITIGICVIVLF